MSDTLNHLPTSYSDLKTCLNIILRHLTRIKIFSCSENLIPGEVGRIWHILVLSGRRPLHLGSLRAIDARRMRVRRTGRAPKRPCACTRSAMRVSDAPYACRMALCALACTRMGLRCAHYCKNQFSGFFLLLFYFNLFQTTSKHFITLQNLFIMICVTSNTFWPKFIFSILTWFA